MNKLIYLWSILICGLTFTYSQNYEEKVLVDGVFAIVGNNVIFHSDIENQILQYQSQESNLLLDSIQLRERVVEELILQKVLLHFAVLDSIDIDMNEVENNINQRMVFFEEQLGSKEKVENYFDKSTIDLKNELRPIIKNQLLTQKMQYEITKDLNISPGDVKEFYNNLHVDSIPIIETHFQIAQVLKIPDAASFEIEETLSKLEDLRNRILEGADFSTMAILYSEDPGSSRNGGVYLNIKKGAFVKEFEAVAFSLNPGEISEIFKTEFGYHIVQLTERRGNEIDVRHILMTPKISSKEMLKAKEFLSSLKENILNEELTFLEAAKQFSSDKDTRYNGGLLINPITNNSFFSISDLDKMDTSLLNEINILSEGEITDPIYIKLSTGKEAYRIIKLVSKLPEHIATLKDDYSFLKNHFYKIKEQEKMEIWYKKKIQDIYISSKDNLYDYEFYNDLKR